MKINHKIQLLKKLPKTSLDPPGTEGLLSSLSPEELAIIKKYERDVNELKTAFENLIPEGMGFNLLLEKQIALLQNAESNTDLLVQRFDILEQRAKGINEAFNINADLSIKLAKSVDKVGKQFKINTTSAKQYLGEINQLIPGLGKLDENNSGYFQNLLQSNDILREQLRLTSGQTLKIRQLAQIQDQKLIPSIEGYVESAAALQDEGTTGAFQIFAEQIENTSLDVLAQYSKMLPDTFFRTTVKAKQLGLTISDIYKTSEAMLDINKQTKASYDFQLVTGKRLETQEYKNVAAAMNRATIEGDMETQLDIINSLVKEHGANIATNMQARKAAADMLNMEPGKLYEIYTRQQEINDLEEEGATFNKQARLDEISVLLQRDKIQREGAIQQSDAVTKSNAQFNAADVDPIIKNILKGVRDLEETEIGQLVIKAASFTGVVSFGEKALKSLRGGLTATDAKPRANGGPVAAGSPYMVGELGPEMFTPSTAGSITPTNQLASSGGGTNAVVEALKGMQFNVINKFDGDAILTSIELAAGNRIT